MGNKAHPYKLGVGPPPLVRDSPPLREGLGVGLYGRGQGEGLLFIYAS